VILRFGWKLLGTKPGRLIVQGVCALMVRNLERNVGPATLISHRRIVRLWHLDRLAAFSSDESPWLLDDGTIVQPDDPVLEMHIAGDRLLEILLAGERWQHVFQKEFASLAPALQQRGGWLWSVAPSCGLKLPSSGPVFVTCRPDRQRRWKLSTGS